jgi:hypothetical protein
MNAPSGVKWECFNNCLGELSGCYHQCLAEKGYYLGGKTKENKTKENKNKDKEKQKIDINNMLPIALLI